MNDRGDRQTGSAASAVATTMPLSVVCLAPRLVAMGRDMNIFASRQDIDVSVSYSLVLKVCERYGIRYEVTRESGWESLWREAHEGNGVALQQFVVGWMHGKGLVIGATAEDAFAWYEKAAEQGLPAAEFCLGYCYESGLGHTVDKRRALAWLERAAAKGHPHAQYLVGYKYIAGDGAERKRSVGEEWLRRSIAQGVTQAMCLLGQVYVDDLGDHCRQQEAIRLWQMAADRGDVGAQLCMGRAHQYGLGGLKEDQRLAAEWYSKGAHRGDGDCAYNLGATYILGEGLPIDEARGVAWLNESSSRGNDMAGVVLSAFYDE